MTMRDTKPNVFILDGSKKEEKPETIWSKAILPVIVVAASVWALNGVLQAAVLILGFYRYFS